ncbi:hypothetical protein DITRI_Ditri12bG0151100 [Diplodiscus trichospermus]
MKSAFRNATHFTLSSYLLNPNPSILFLRLVPAISAFSSLPSSVSKNLPFRSPLTATLSSTSMASGDSNAMQTSPSLEQQFEKFRVQLEDSGSLRERIRAVVLEIELATGLMQASLLLVHQSKPIPEVLEKAKAQINVLKDLYNKLAEVVRECPGQYYRFHGDWRGETQMVVSLLAFMHWLETGTLLMHTEAEEMLGLNNSDFGLDVEDYLVGICFMSNEMPRYVVNQVTAGDYDCPRKMLKFLTDLHAAFRMLNLRNDFLRKKFDSKLNLLCFAS